jgi:sugar O-acyltransferase (sialic acid O-acetyltransferase NeuD family)
MIEPRKIIVPKENVSDETYHLVEWLVEEGDKVSAGTVVAVLESSKAALDILADADGYIFFNAASKDDVAIGSVLAVVSSENVRPDSLGLTVQENEPPKELESKFSKKALKLIQEHDLDPQAFADLSLVRTEDVQRYLQIDPPSPSVDTSSIQRIVVYGGGGMGKMTIDLLLATNGYVIEGIIDDELKAGTEVMGVKVLGGSEMLSTLKDRGVRFAALAIGMTDSNGCRENFYRKLKDAGLLPLTLIHPSATVEPTATLGEGSLVFANAVIGSCASVGANCIINTGAIVSHDCRLEEGVHVTPGAILAGGVRVGRYTLVGMGVTVYMGVCIGSRVIIMNGCNIVGNIADGCEFFN